ncbi:MAG: hypothetical protein KGL39_07620 [Patescibacteria group bacterium]|nr:hypothetical protein [Patescibacteria group bacterium]
MNPEKYRSRNKRFRERDPDRQRAQNRAAYLRHREERIAQTHVARSLHPEWRQTERTNLKARRPWHQSLLNARNRAAKKGYEFDLTREWAAATWTGFCAVSGLPFVFGKQRRFPFSPSIDRIDSSRGYTQDNCRFVLFAVNSLKGNGTDEEMVKIAHAIAERSSPTRTADIHDLGAR